MKKNKGFFLAETIIVLALVTTAIAFVYPNVSKLYENYVNVTKYYDQTEDLYILKAISKLEKVEKEEKEWEEWRYVTKNITIRPSFADIIDSKTSSWCDTIDVLVDISDSFDVTTKKLLVYDKLYITSYLSTPQIPDGYTGDEYEFKKYLKRLKKTSFDETSYRLIGVFKGDDGETRYASIKILNEKIDECP